MVKKMVFHQKTKWILAFVLVLLPLFLFLPQTRPIERDSYHAKLLDHMEDASSFQEFTELLFRYEVTADSVTTDHTLKNPKSKNIPVLEPSLSSFSYKEYLHNAKPQTRDKTTSLLRTFLKRYDAKKLSSKDRLTYHLLDDYLNTTLSLSGYSFYEDLLGGTTGVQTNLPVTLGEYPFHDAADVETYLALLTQIPSYFQDVIRYQEYRKSLGYETPAFLTVNALNNTKTILKGLKQEKNCFQDTFQERISQIKGLSKKQRIRYQKQNDSYVEKHVIPSYEKIISYLEQQIPTNARDSVSIPKDCKFGTSTLPQGKDYYALLAKQYTGSNKTVEQMISNTEVALENATGTVFDIALKDQDAYFYYCQHPLESFYQSPKAILDNLSLFMLENYPALSSKPTYEIKTVPESLAESVSPAFFMIPAIDDYQNNTIYINEKETNEENGNLFPTLAHEGFPGHMYQTVYFNQSNPPDIRQILTYLGYVEGWATYVEIDSLNYLEYAIDGDSLPKLYQAETIINLGLCARIDMGVNYEGWTLNDTKAFFEEQGFNSYYASDVYTYVVEAPANYLSYFIGYLEILEIKDAYQRLKMEHYSEKEFHKRFLDVGPADFETVRNYVLGE